MTNKVLIVGASGFIGRHVARGFLREGVEVNALDPAPASHGAAGISIFIGAATEKDLLRNAATGCDTVVWLASAGLPGSQGVPIHVEITSGVGVVLESAEICFGAGVKKFIFASSGGTVYGADSDAPIHETTVCRPRNFYGVSKYSCEHYLRIMAANLGAVAISLRISNPYGEGQIAHSGQGFVAAAIEAMLSSRPLTIWGDGTVVRDFVYVEDLAHAVVNASRYDGESLEVNIGSGVGASLLDVVELINSTTGGRLQLNLTAERAVDVKRNVLDISRAAEVFGWVPRIRLAEGIRRTTAWWLESRPEGV